MTDQHGDPPHDGSLPELTPAQESQVRRLLAEARHDEPIPAEVSDRLDRVLAGLTLDDPGAPAATPLVDLAARRRRRNVAALLAGAAAVIVGGFAVGQVIDVGSGGSGDSASSGAVSADRAAPSPEQGPQRRPRNQGVSPSHAVPQPAREPSVLRLRSTHLERDLERQLGGIEATSDSASHEVSGFAAVGCAKARTPSSAFGLGELFPALYDDRPAVVALRPAVQGRQQADVLACDTAATLATASVPAR